jgi:hypothetical protein
MIDGRVFIVILHGFGFVAGMDRNRALIGHVLHSVWLSSHPGIRLES